MEEATLQMMRKLAADMDRAAGHVGGNGPSAAALKAVLASREAFETRLKGAKLRGFPFAVELDSDPDSFTGRTAQRVIHSVTRPIRATIENDQAPLDSNPIHPYFFLATNPDATWGHWQRSRYAGLDQEAQAMMVMSRMMTACANRQFEIVPPVIWPSEFRSSRPDIFWFSRIVGSEGQFTDRSLRDDDKPALSECWGYAEVIRGQLDAMAEHIFGHQSLIGRRTMSAAASMRLSSARRANFKSPMRLNKDLKDLVEAAGVDRDAVTPVSAAGMQTRAFSELADGNPEAAAVIMSVLAWTYPEATTDSSQRHLVAYLVGSSNGDPLDAVARHIVEGTAGDLAPLPLGLQRPTPVVIKSSWRPIDVALDAEPAGEPLPEATLEPTADEAGPGEPVAETHKPGLGRPTGLEGLRRTDTPPKTRAPRRLPGLPGGPGEGRGLQGPGSIGDSGGGHSGQR